MWLSALLSQVITTLRTGSETLNFDFFKEKLVWSQHHVFTPFVAQYFIQSPSIALLLVYVWEVAESISFLASDTYFGGSEEIELVSDSYLGDPLCGLLGIICATIMSMVLSSPRVFTHPKLILRESQMITQGDVSYVRSFRPDHLDALWSVLKAPTTSNSRPIILILVLTVIFSLTKQFDWTPGGTTGFTLGLISNTVVGLLSYVFLRGRPQIQWDATQNLPEPQLVKQIAARLGQTDDNELNARVVDPNAAGFSRRETSQIRSEIVARIRQAAYLSPSFDDQNEAIADSSPSVVEDTTTAISGGRAQDVRDENKKGSPESRAVYGAGIGSTPLPDASSSYGPLMSHRPPPLDELLVSHDDFGGGSQGDQSAMPRSSHMTGVSYAGEGRGTADSDRPTYSSSSGAFDSYLVEHETSSNRQTQKEVQDFQFLDVEDITQQVTPTNQFTRESLEMLQGTYPQSYSSSPSSPGYGARISHDSDTLQSYSSKDSRFDAATNESLCGSERNMDDVANGSDRYDEYVVSHHTHSSRLRNSRVHSGGSTVRRTVSKRDHETSESEISTGAIVSGAGIEHRHGGGDDDIVEDVSLSLSESLGSPSSGVEERSNRLPPHRARRGVVGSAELEEEANSQLFDSPETEAPVGPVDRFNTKCGAIEWHIGYFYALFWMSAFVYVQFLFLPDVSMWFFTTIPIMIGTLLMVLFYPRIRRRMIERRLMNELEATTGSESTTVVAGTPSV